MFPSSFARSPDTHKTRQTLSWIAMSTRMLNKIAKAKAAPIWTVKTDVWVRKPGPIAEVAMRNMAPAMAPNPRGGFLVGAIVSALTEAHFRDEGRTLNVMRIILDVC